MSYAKNAPAAPAADVNLADPAIQAAIAAAVAAKLAEMPRGGRPKTPCTISREEFAAKAGAVEIIVDGHVLTAEPKMFASGGFGWYVGGKVSMDVGGRKLLCQLGLNLVAVNSKDAK